jgi:glutathione S-transferase
LYGQRVPRYRGIVPATRMKLYGVLQSNFTSKCRIVLHEKGLLGDVDLVPVPVDGPGAAAYRAMNPLGKIPALEVDGAVIVESEVINEYLEERFPEPALLPSDALGRARVRVVSRFHDLYLEPALRVLYPRGNEAVDPAVVEARLPEVWERFDQLERMLGEPWAAGATFTLADCALAPTMLFASLLMRVLRRPAVVEGRTKVREWWRLVRTRPSVRAVLQEQRTSLVTPSTR